MDTDPLFADDDTFHLRLYRPEDVLAYLPYRFGFVPTDSLAVLAVVENESGHTTLGLAARLDLRDLDHPDVLRSMMDGLRDQLEQDPTVCVLTVIYSDADPAEVRAGRGPAGRVLSRWLAELPYADPTATYLVSSETYRCLECAQPGCCQVGGQSLELLAHTEVAAQMVLAGEVIAPSRDGLACPRGAGAERQPAATRAADRERRGLTTRHAPRAVRWRATMLDLYGSFLEDALAVPANWAPMPADLGRLGAALDDPHTRDAVVAWSVGGRRLPAGCTAVLDTFTGMMTGTLRPPGREHLNAAMVVLTEVARHAPPGRGGYPLAFLAWLAWWRGDGARADVVLRQCLREQPDNSLGGLLHDVLDAGVRPGWARPDATVAPGVR